MRELRSIEEYDDNAKSLVTELEQIDGLLNDFNRNIAEYLADMEFDGEVFAQTQERLNLLNHLKLKYGGTIEAVLEYQQQQAQRIEKLQNMDAYREQLVQKRPVKGLAIAGIITGIFGILLSILFILVYVVAVLAL